MICLPTSATLKQDGSLVVDPRIWRRLEGKFPEFRKYAGTLVSHVAPNHTEVRNFILCEPVYGFKIVKNDAGDKFGLFQVKFGFWKEAQPEIIKQSVLQLNKYIQEWSPADVSLLFPYAVIMLDGLDKRVKVFSK